MAEASNLNMHWHLKIHRYADIGTFIDQEWAVVGVIRNIGKQIMAFID